MTFQEWQATRTWRNDLSTVPTYDWLTETPGFTYEPLGVIEAPAGGAMPDLYNVVIANTEQQFTTLEAAESYLWNEFARDEIAAD